MSPCKIYRFSCFIISFAILNTYLAEPQVKSSPQPILFESIGTMVASLSYLHTYIPLNLSAIEEQILRYRQAIVPDGDEHLPLLNVIRQKVDGTVRYYSRVGNKQTEISPLTIKLWDEIIDIHQREIDDMLLDIRTLKSILPTVSEDPGNVIQAEGKNLKHKPDPERSSKQNDRPIRVPQDRTEGLTDEANTILFNEKYKPHSNSRSGPQTAAKTVPKAPEIKPQTAARTIHSFPEPHRQTDDQQIVHPHPEVIFPHWEDNTVTSTTINPTTTTTKPRPELDKRHRSVFGQTHRFPRQEKGVPPTEFSEEYIKEAAKEQFPTPEGAGDPQFYFNMGEIQDIVHKGQTGINMGNGGVKAIQKRALPLILAGLALAIPGVLGTAMGIYNSAQISHLWTEVNSHTQSINRLISVAEAHDIHLRELDAAVRDIGALVTSLFIYNPSLLTNRLYRIENQIKHRLMKSIHLIQQAQHRRLPVDYLTDTDIRSLFSALIKRADSYGCALAIDKHSDIYQLETSYLYNGESISLILHVPMYPTDSILRLYKLHPFPLPFFEEKFLIPDVKNDVLGIAVFDSTYHIQMTATELLGCHRINQMYFCERNGVLAKDENFTCLGALYHSKYELARKICNFHIEPVREFIYQLLDNWFIIYTPVALTIPTKCRNGTTKELFISKHITRFHLSPGCFAQFPSHRVFSDLSIKLPTDFVQLEWEWESVDDVFREVTGVKYIMPELDRLNQFGMDRPRLADLQTLLMQSHRSPWWSFPAFSTGTIIAIVLFIIICIFVFIRLWSRRRRQRQKQLEQQNQASQQVPLVPMGQSVCHRRTAYPAVPCGCPSCLPSTAPDCHGSH